MFRNSSESPDKQKVKEFLTKYADGRYRDSVIEFIPESGKYLILVPDAVRPFSSKAATTLRNRLQKELGLDSDVEKYSSFENGAVIDAMSLALENLIGSNFVDVAMLNSPYGAIDIIIYVESEDDRDRIIPRPKIARKINSFLQAYDLSVGIIYITALAQESPTRPQVLWTIYKLSPASFEEISKGLSKQGLAVPSETWLKRLLDSLVRARAIIWDEPAGDDSERKQPGRYQLTNLGASALPHRRGRNSPDVARALELGRRKW